MSQRSKKYKTILGYRLIAPEPLGFDVDFEIAPFTWLDVCRWKGVGYGYYSQNVKVY